MIIEIGTPNQTGNDLVVKLNIKSVNETDKTILADCLDSEGKVVSKDNWFIYSGPGKNVPFTLTKAQIKEINSK